MGAVDVWAQLTTERMLAEPWLRTLQRWTKDQRTRSVPTVTSTLAAMDEANVDIALLSAWHGPQGSLISNEEVSSAIDQAPGRFRGLLTVDLRDPVEATRTIRRLGADERFVGVRIVPWL
jgi:predicted TIM-barrel fold metal-dependent hydrolase